MADWHATAVALKAEGLSNSEIGRRVGKDRRTVSDLFRMPLCACGNRMVLTSSARCRACEDGARRQAADERLEDIARMYEEGMPIRGIADALGYGPKSQPWELTALRKAGRIGYRYTAYENRAA